MKDIYHQRKFKKCKYCEKESLRNIRPDGRNKGHYRTCGSKECLSKNYTDEKVIEKKKHIGKDNPNWLGDRKLLKRPMCSIEGKIWRLSIYERDNFTCQKCGQKGGKLQAHHIKGYWSNPEIRWDINNGITLCVDCHKKTDNYGWKSINIRK